MCLRQLCLTPIHAFWLACRCLSPEVPHLCTLLCHRLSVALLLLTGILCTRVMICSFTRAAVPASPSRFGVSAVARGLRFCREACWRGVAEIRVCSSRECSLADEESSCCQWGGHACSRPQLPCIRAVLAACHTHEQQPQPQAHGR